MKRRDVLIGSGAIATAAALAPRALAQGAAGFPNRAISLLVPWNAGGSTDLWFRAFAEPAGKLLGQPVVVDNKPGGTGTLAAATMAATAKPDGYTVAQAPVTVFRLPQMQRMTLNPLADLSYIIHLSGYVLGVTCKADSPFQSWADVVKFAKDNPGKLTYATTGAGGTLHLGMEQIAAREGIRITMVPFKGGAETNAAILGGHVMLQADSTVWRPLVDSGQLRLLNIWTAERNPRWPSVPTLKELGYPFVFDSPFGLVGPKGMDPAVIEKLHQAFKSALEDAKSKELMNTYDFVARYMGPAEYATYAKELFAQERAALERLGLLRKE